GTAVFCSSDPPNAASQSMGRNRGGVVHARFTGGAARSPTRATLGGLKVMLRTLSLTLAVAAILAIPFSQADARSRGGWSGHSFGRVGMHHVGVGRGGVGRGRFVHPRGFL